MALVSIYKRDNVKTLDDTTKSTPLGINNGFVIERFKNRFFDINSSYWKCGVDSFQGIMLDDISINLKTSWGDAGGAILGKNIESKINTKFVKILASQSDNGFMPFIASDAWTQQKVSGDASPISVSLKFRAFNEDRMGLTNYNSIIKFLIQIVSPIKSTSVDNNDKLGDQIVANLENAAVGGSNLIGELIGAGKQFLNDDKDSVIQAGAALVNTVNRTYNNILAGTSDGKNNGNFTILFKLGNLGNNENTKYARKINQETIENSDGSSRNKVVIDWIVDNFTFKPSRQFEMVNGLPKPLWVDFDLTISTRLSLSNKYIYNILVNDNKIN